MDQGRGSGYGAEVGQKLNYGNDIVWQKQTSVAKPRIFRICERKKYWLDIRQGWSDISKLRNAGHQHKVRGSLQRRDKKNVIFASSVEE